LSQLTTLTGDLTSHLIKFGLKILFNFISMVFNGYGERGNDILGLGNKPEVEPYETLVYATGPGFNYHLANDTKEMFVPIPSFTDKQRSEPTYMSLSLIQVSWTIKLSKFD
jgi:hypothetical protein